MVNLPEPSQAHAVSLQALIDGWTDAGEGMRRLLFEAPLYSACRLPGFMDAGIYANPCGRYHWIMVWSDCNAGSDQAMILYCATTVSSLCPCTLETHLPQAIIVQ